MADSDQLLFILKMRDEASSVLKQATAAVKDHGKAHEESARHVGTWRGLISHATGNAGTFGGAVRNVASSMISLGAPIAGGILAAHSLEAAYAGVVRVFKEMISNTVDYEKSQKALGMAMRVTGNAVGMTKSEVNEVVDKQSQGTLTDDTDVRNAAAKLMIMGRVTNETFKPAMDMSVQLSKVMGGDLVSASRMLARALADPERGMSMLRRAGIMLNEAEKERIKLMGISGGRSAAQAEALRILAERLGTSDNSGVGKGLSGALKQAAFAWDEFLDQFNDSILSKATEQLIKLTAEGVNMITFFNKSPTAPDTETDLDEKIAKQRKYVEQLKAIQNPNAQVRNVAIPGAIAALVSLEERLNKVAEASKKAFDVGEATAFKNMMDELSNGVTKLGVAYDDTTGKMVESAAKQADGAVDRAKAIYAAASKRLTEVSNDSTGFYSRADLNKARQSIEEANNLLTGAEEAAKKAGATRAATAKDEDALEIARTAQSQRRIKAAEQEAKARMGALGFKAGDAAYDTEVLRAKGDAAKKIALEFADVNAATSREVQYQMDLAKAYGVSTQAANNLINVQKSKEAQATGKGNPDADDAQTLEFMKNYVKLSADLRKEQEAMPDLAAAAAAAKDPVEAFWNGIVATVTAKQRELAALAVTGDEGQQEMAKKKGEELLQSARQAAALKLQQSSNEAAASLRTDIELNERKISVAGQSQVQQDIAVGLLAVEIDRRRMLKVAIDGQLSSQEELDLSKRREAVTAKANSDEDARRANGPMAQYIQSSKDQFADYENAGVKAFHGVEEAMADALDGTKSIGESMHGVIKAMIHDLEVLAIRRMVIGPIADSLFGGGGGSGGGGGGGGMLGGILAKGAGMFMGMFADGGVMTKDGPIPLRKYSTGGIANSPQMAMFGEGSVPEAYVPVPSGRIPVELRMQAGPSMNDHSVETVKNVVQSAVDHLTNVFQTSNVSNSSVSNSVSNVSAPAGAVTANVEIDGLDALFSWVQKTVTSAAPQAILTQVLPQADPVQSVAQQRAADVTTTNNAVSVLKEVRDLRQSTLNKTGYNTSVVTNIEGDRDNSTSLRKLVDERRSDRSTQSDKSSSSTSRASLTSVARSTFSDMAQSIVDQTISNKSTVKETIRDRENVSVKNKGSDRDVPRGVTPTFSAVPDPQLTPYVPSMQAGRIPVGLRGGGASNASITTNVTVNMPVSSGGGSSGGNKNGGFDSRAQSQELGALVTAMVNKNLTDQMRPGGILNPNGSNRGGM